MSDLPNCPECKSAYTYEDGLNYVCPECAHEWSKDAVASADDDTRVPALDIALQGFLWHRAFRAQEKAGAHGNAVSTPGQGSHQAGAVLEASGSNHRHFVTHRGHHLRQQ